MILKNNKIKLRLISDSEKDYKYLDKVTDLSFLGGE